MYNAAVISSVVKLTKNDEITAAFLYPKPFCCVISVGYAKL